MRHAKPLIVGAVFVLSSASYGLAEDSPLDNGPLSHFELVVVQSGEELRSISFGMGSGTDVQIESGYISAEGEFIEIEGGKDTDFYSGIGSYSSVIVFGEE